jgi:hypothetical protein
MRLRDPRQWAIALACATIVTCVSAGPSSASTPSQRIVLAKYGFSLSLPAGWQRTQLTKAGVTKLVQRLDKLDPKQANLLSSASAQATIRRLQFYAIGPPDEGLIPNMNVIVQSPAGLPSGTSFVSQIKPVMAQALAKDGYAHVTFSTVHLPLGAALQAQYTAPTTSVLLTQLYISHKGHLYIATFTPSSVAAQIENTWRWQ